MNTETILFWIFLLGFLICFLAYYHQGHQGRSYGASSLVLDAALIAIIFLMGFVPQLGYLTVVPGFSLTLMVIPVLVGASRASWKRGLVYGLAFGVTSCLQALSNPVGLNALFVYPWISILPRALFGALASLIFQLARKTPKIYKGPFPKAVLSFLLSLLHTALVFLALFVFYGQEMVALFSSQEILISSLGWGFLALILMGALGEAILAGILVPLIGGALDKAEMRRNP